MKQINKAIGIFVVLALMVTMVTAASASAPAKLALTTDKNLYNWNEAPIITIRNAGNVNIVFSSATLEIRDNSGAAVYSHKFDIGTLKPNRRFAVQLLLPAGKYKAVLVYSLTGDRNKYTISSSAFVVTPSLTLTTVVNGAQDVRFTVTNPGTKPIDLSPVQIQVYTADGVPVYLPFSVSSSRYYLLQPKASINLGWGLYPETPAGTYQGKLMVPTSSGVIVVNGDLFTVKPPLTVVAYQSSFNGVTVNFTNIDNIPVDLSKVQYQMFFIDGTPASDPAEYVYPQSYLLSPKATYSLSFAIYIAPGNIRALPNGTYYIKTTMVNIYGNSAWDSAPFTLQ